LRDVRATVPTLAVENLHVVVAGREVLKGVWLEVRRGELHVLMGPNASGKTTFVMALLGHPAYRIVKGRLLFEGRDISGLSTTERVRLGIGVAFQNPPVIRGVKLRDIIRACMGLWSRADPPEELMIDVLRRAGLEPRRYLTRDLNLGFSGGEKKRAELAQVMAMRPKLMIFDEPDSGVDLDSLKLIGENIRALSEELGSATLVITHYRHIIPYLKPDEVHVLYGGRIIASGPPNEILDALEALGYRGFALKMGLTGGGRA